MEYRRRSRGKRSRPEFRCKVSRFEAFYEGTSPSDALFKQCNAMNKYTESVEGATPPPLSRRQRKKAIASWEAERKRELNESLAVLKARRTEERRQRLTRGAAALWPLWAGILLGMLSPLIHWLAAFVGPLCVAFIFPFVVLAQRPDIQVGPITGMLPGIMLYAQFPIEGLLTRVVLKRHTHPLSVVWQVSLFHFLGLMELWMLSGGARNLVW